MRKIRVANKPSLNDKRKWREGNPNKSGSYASSTVPKGNFVVARKMFCSLKLSQLQTSSQMAMKELIDQCHG